MYRTIKDFKSDWQQETESTLKIFHSLTDASLSQKVTSSGRSLGFLAWHITMTMAEMGGRTGLRVSGPEEKAPVPAHTATLVKAYETAAQSLLNEVKNNWTDETLGETVDMYGEQWTRGFALSSLLRHQTHHRGQMTVLMRQAGLRVPGVCGPSHEEWAQWGMPAMQ